MKYMVRWPKGSFGELTTQDGKVVAASDNMSWSIGRTLYGVQYWAKGKAIKLTSVDDNGTEHLLEIPNEH